MNRGRFVILYVLFVVVQIVSDVYLDFWPPLTLALLPALLLCLRIETGPLAVMAVAFATGFAVDFLGDGMLGLTCLSLLPVAILRRPIISLVFGSEVFARGENISARRQGPAKMLLAIAIATALYLIVYVVADGAGTRPGWFNVGKIAVSLAFSTLASYFICALLTSESDRRWR